MNNELLQTLQPTDRTTQTMIEHVQNCIVIYEETLRAMGVLPQETVSQAIDNSQLSYAHQMDVEGSYANIPDSY